jgi:hypothetical protein
MFYLIVLVEARKPTGGGSITSNRFPTSEEEEEDDDQFEDDARVYKNPRNSPSAQCPRDEEQAELLVSLLYREKKEFYIIFCKLNWDY